MVFMICQGKDGWGWPTLKTAVTLEKKILRVTKRIKTSHEPGLRVVPILYQ